MKTVLFVFFFFISFIAVSAQPSSNSTPSPTPQPIRESVTVSADKPQPIDEVSKTVNVITGQEMRDRADITLVDSLRSIPGLPDC